LIKWKWLIRHTSRTDCGLSLCGMQAFSKTHQGREIAFAGFTTPSSYRLPFRNGWGRQCPFRALAACQRRRPLLHKPAREEWPVTRRECLIVSGLVDLMALWSGWSGTLVTHHRLPADCESVVISYKAAGTLALPSCSIRPRNAAASSGVRP
jgi:hypothetical protein